MQLTTTKAVELLNLFSQLTGYPEKVELNGKTQIIIVPWDIGPKAQWNAVKNRNVLRPLKNMSDELVAEKQKQLGQLLSSFDPNLPPDERAQRFSKEQRRIDDDQKKHFDEIHEVAGLLKIPAKDIRIRRTDTVIQNLLEGLMSEGFLDGEPDFGDAPSK